MIEQLIGWDPLAGFKLKAFVNEIQARKTHSNLLGNSPFSFLYIESKVVSGNSSEWSEPTEKFINDNS